jgi:hypothetical protein
MNVKKWITLAAILAGLVLLVVLVVQASPPRQQPGAQGGVGPQGGAVGTGFTYQGQLEVGGEPVSADCEMAFRLYDGASGGNQVSYAVTHTVPVSDGLFTVVLNFGSGAFDGGARWLGIQVQCPGDAAYADLGRQALTAAPYALYATSAPWNGLSGVPAGFDDNLDNDTTYTAGAGLTLSGTEFTVVSSTIQQRVTGACGAGYVIQQINADGSVVCRADDNTTYTAGAGLTLSGTEFSVQGSAYENVVIVAKGGGDYITVQEAIDSITDAGPSNPYLVWVAPGVYSETVAMKPYVHLQGAGQEATVINSTASFSFPELPRATLVLTRDASLRDLTVGNSGTGDNNVALHATAGTARTLVADVTARAQGSSPANFAITLSGTGTDVTLQDVTALAEGAQDSYGLDNAVGASTTLLGGSFTARAGKHAHGIMSSGTLDATGITALGEGGGYCNYGLVNRGTSRLRGGSFTARGGLYETRGIFNYVAISTLEATSITAVGEGGSTENYGLYQGGGTVRLGVTQLVGGAIKTGGTLTCFQVYSGTFASYTCP